MLLPKYILKKPQNTVYLIKPVTLEALDAAHVFSHHIHSFTAQKTVTVGFEVKPASLHRHRRPEVWDESTPQWGGLRFTWDTKTWGTPTREERKIILNFQSNLTGNGPVRPSQALFFKFEQMFYFYVTHLKVLQYKGLSLVWGFKPPAHTTHQACKMWL